MPALLNLARAAHAGPSVVVTTVAGSLAAGFGGTAGQVLLVVAAVLTGQLSIGWSNDAIDVRRDRQVGRTDKPAVSGDIATGFLALMAAVAAVASAVLSVAMGVQAGLVHLGLVVAMGWAYNLGLKATMFSALPYAVAFGMLPSVAALAVAGQWAPAWLGAAGAGMGVTAHLANCLPDLEDDAATGVRGLPHRLGDTGARTVAAVVLASTIAVVLTGAGLNGPAIGAVVVVSAAALGMTVRGPGRSPFIAILALAVVIVVVAARRMAG